MSNSSNQLIILVFAILTLISAVLGEIVSFDKCDGEQAKCNVHEVRVDPCNEASEGKPCKMKRGKSAAIAVDYTPQFSSDSLHSRAYWDNGLVDLPLLDMETDGCKTTTCPVVEGNRQTYTYDLKLSRAFPTGIYLVKWRLTGENDDDQCCFKFKIQLK